MANFYNQYFFLLCKICINFATPVLGILRALQCGNFSLQFNTARSAILDLSPIHVCRRINYDHIQ